MVLYWMENYDLAIDTGVTNYITAVNTAVNHIMLINICSWVLFLSLSTFFLYCVRGVVNVRNH